jgi:hypothetical protein
MNMNIALRSIVITSTQSRQTQSAGGSGDISVGVATTTTWANPADHSQTYGISQSGPWQWYVNIFPEFGFPACASFFIGYGGTVQSGSVELDLELLDASSSVLTSASMSVNYSVDLTTFVGFTYNVIAGPLTAGPEKIDSWNAVRVRSTCNNTNLNQLLNYGPLGSFPIVGAFVVYPQTNTIIDRFAL